MRAHPKGCDLSHCGAAVARDGLCATCAAALDAVKRAVRTPQRRTPPATKPGAFSPRGGARLPGRCHVPSAGARKRRAKTPRNKGLCHNRHERGCYSD
jgi:hypothetical protein